MSRMFVSVGYIIVLIFQISTCRAEELPVSREESIIGSSEQCLTACAETLAASCTQSAIRYLRQDGSGEEALCPIEQDVFFDCRSYCTSTSVQCDEAADQMQYGFQASFMELTKRVKGEIDASVASGEPSAILAAWTGAEAAIRQAAGVLSNELGRQSQKNGNCVIARRTVTYNSQPPIKLYPSR